MTLKSFFRHTLLGEPEPVIADNPFGKTTPSPIKPPAPPPTPALLQREEILDERNRICGYRFLAHSYGDAAPVSTTAFLTALGHESVASFAQRRMAMIPVTVEAWNRHDFTPVIGPHTTLLLPPPPAPLTEDWCESLKAMKAEGAKIALRGLTDSEDLAPAALLADLVLLNFGEYPLARLEKLAQALSQRHPHLALVADGLGAWAERRLCGALGFHYFLGGFASSPDEEAPEGELNESRLVLIEMLNLLRRDADLNDLGIVAKRDPGVSVHVIAMANSPMAGLATPVASVEQAIVVLGREYLYRWLAIAMFRVGNHHNDLDETLLELALARARFLELLGVAGRGGRQTGSELFLVGLLSLLDSLLKIPIEKIVSRMHLPESVAQVLLRSEGIYGRYLRLSIAMERGRSDQAARLANELSITPELLTNSNQAALVWAEEAMRMQ